MLSYNGKYTQDMDIISAVIECTLPRPYAHIHFLIQKKKHSSDRTSFGTIQLEFRATCHAPESPLSLHAFSNSSSSERIEGASGNRGVILHGYGSGRLDITSPKISVYIQRDSVKRQRPTKSFLYRQTFLYQQAPLSHFRHKNVRTEQPKAQ